MDLGFSFIHCRSPVKINNWNFILTDTQFKRRSSRNSFAENIRNIPWSCLPIPPSCCLLEGNGFDVLWSSHIDALHNVWMGTKTFHSAHFEELLLSGWRPLKQLGTCTVFIYPYAFCFFCLIIYTYRLIFIHCTWELIMTTEPCVMGTIAFIQSMYLWKKCIMAVFKSVHLHYIDC